MPQLTEGLAAAGWEAAYDCGVLASHSSKALESAAEAARVKAAQLEAYAVLLEREAEDEEEADEVAFAARALLCNSGRAAPALWPSRGAARH